jgi:GntR family transcriptional regulator, transcriptional repressor for pyruvate dehydrogenase complex
VTLVPLARTTVTEAAFEKLIEHIVKGDWPEGARIPSERELGQLLGIGRASLREALKALELIGMLDSRVGDGTFVCARSEFLSRPLLWAITGTDRTELRDLVEARRLVEEDIAALAAERATKEELTRIGDAVEQLRGCLRDPQASLDADIAFHVALGEAAHNQILLNAVQLFRNLMRHWIHLKLQVPGVPGKVLEQHETIYQAVRHRDPQLARQSMNVHLGSMGRLLIDVVGRR